MDTMPPPMAIPRIHVDEQEADQVEDLHWQLPYGQSPTLRDYYPTQQRQQQQQHHFQSQPPPQPFKIQTDLPLEYRYRQQQQQQQQFNTPLERYVEDQFSFAVPQSAPVRDFSPFETTWVPESAPPVAQYHDRLSSSDDTVLSSASGSNYWPSSTFSSRFDGVSVSCSPASPGHNLSRRGSAFGSMSAASDLHDAFTWARNDQMCPVSDSANHFSDLVGPSGANYPNIATSASAQISRHASPLNALFSTEMDIDGRSSSNPPQSVAMQHSHSHSHSSHLSSVAQFRCPSPHDAPYIRQSLTPALSDFDIPLKSDNDCDSDYTPGRAERRFHRPSRSATTSIRRPAYQHARASSYNAACGPSPHSPSSNRISKRSHARRGSSTNHIPQYSPKSSSRHHPSGSSLSSFSGPGTIHPPTPQAPRPFTCPLTPYSCPKTFTSKNEWKRHVLTQHLLLGFWRCDLCPDAQTRPNDFNRKDLFVQHLRRMHCGDRRGSASVFTDADGCMSSTAHTNETTEQALERVRKRCWIQLRKPPQKLTCCFCAKIFESKPTPTGEQERERGCAVDWLEHVGRHLVALTGGTPISASGSMKAEDACEGDKKGHRRKKSGSGASKSSVDAALKDDSEREFTEPPWAEDTLLLEWLIDEGLVEQSNIRKEMKWVLVDRGIASEAAMTRRSEKDAMGDLDEQ